MFTLAHLQLLRVIREAESISRLELAAHTNLSKAAVSTLTRDLVDHGIVKPTDTVRGQGRPSVRLSLEPSFAYFVGVSLVEMPTMVLTDLGGNICASCVIGRSGDPGHIGRLIAEGLPKLLAGVSGARRRLRGVGVALAGLVDASQQVCLRSTQLGWQDVPAARLIAQEVGLPTAIENDANALALGEKLFGDARQSRSFTLVSVGDGVGCAHVINDTLYCGAHGGAGEIAHISIEPDGTPCRCGKRGCLDTISSLFALHASATAADLPPSVDALGRLAAGGNPAAIAILHRAGNALGLAIAHVIQIIDPELVIVTHLDGILDGLYGTVVRAAIRANVLPRVADEIEIQFRKVTSEGWARGAASIATSKFLADPALLSARSTLEEVT